METSIRPNWKEMKMNGNIRPTELKRNENRWKHPSDWIEKKWKWMEKSIRPNWKEMKMDGNIRSTELKRNENGWKHSVRPNWKEMKMDGNIRPTKLKRNETSNCVVWSQFIKRQGFNSKTNIFWIMFFWMKLQNILLNLPVLCVPKSTESTSEKRWWKISLAYKKREKWETFKLSQLLS